MWSVHIGAAQSSVGTASWWKIADSDIFDARISHFLSTALLNDFSKKKKLKIKTLIL